MHPTANRIPRIAAKPPSLSRRLYCWLRCLPLRARVVQLEYAVQNLQHEQALSLAAATVHGLNYTKSPVLQHRMQVEAQAMDDLQAQLLSARLELAFAESEYGL